MPNLTPEQYGEFVKCREDFKYFASNYLHIIHPQDGLVPFKLYQFQERVVKDFETYKYCITKKFRQAGLTTAASMWMLWRAMFYPDQRIMIISKTDREAQGVAKTVHNAKKNLPDWLQPEMGNDNNHEKEFDETGSVMWFFTPNAARSRSLTYLVVDEAAFIPGMEEHWAALYPTLSGGGNCIIISTVNGMGGTGQWYYEMYMNAVDRKNKFHIIQIDWREHPDYNNADWEHRSRSNLGARRFSQEIEGSFLGSSESYIPGDVIVEMEKRCTEPISKSLGEWDLSPEELLDAKYLPNDKYEPGAMWVWERPKPGRDYVVVADAAEGRGRECDQSAFIVMESATLTQVAEFYSNTIPPFRFAQVLSQVARMYNTALLVVENTMGPGQAVCERLQHDLRYDHIYYTQNSNGERVGFTLNRNTRVLCMEAMQTCILNNLVKVRSRRITRELLTFIYNQTKGKAEAQKGKHDDLVISLAIGLHVCDVMGRGLPAGVDVSNELITQTFTIAEDFLRLKEELVEHIRDPESSALHDILIDLMPKAAIQPPRRPMDSLLREFGF